MVGTLQISDYEKIEKGVALAKEATQHFVARGCRIDIGHSHRWWEYGTALELYMKHRPHDVLSVGAGADALGPSLARNFDVEVVECEPDDSMRQARTQVNKTLLNDNRKAITVLPNPILNLPPRKFDMVCCISVIEHVRNEIEAWKELGRRVKPNGILYITTDCIPVPGRHYEFDNLRETNYTLQMLMERVGMLKDFTPLDTPDWVWHGEFVFDYTFFRVGLVRN